MVKKLHFECDFDDLGPDRITYEVTDPPTEIACTTIEGGVPVLYVNKEACRLLAEIFARLALGTHRDGFHLHLRENFDSDASEMMRIVVDSQNREKMKP